MSNDKIEHPLTEQTSSDILDAIHAIAVAGTQASDEDRLLEQATHIVGTFLNPDNFGVMLLDREKESLVLHPSYRRSSDMAHLESVPLGQGVTGHVAQSGQPIRVDDVNEDARYIPVNPQVRSELCVPLVVNDELIGVVDAESVEPNGFSSTDEIVLVTIAAQLATAIDRLRRTAEAKQQAQQIATIYELGREITAILRLDELLPAIVRLITDTLGLDGVQIALIEDAYLVCKASHKADKEYQRRTELPEEGGLLGNVIHTGAAETIRDPTKMVDLCGVNLENVSAEMILPLRLDSVIIGVLIITCRNPQEETICQIELLEFLADQVAVAIQNAQLFAAAKQKTEKLGSLYETALVTSTVLEPNQLFQELYEQIEPLLSPEHFHMALCNLDSPKIDVTFLISRGENAPQIRRIPHVEDGGLTEWVLENRESLLIRDAHSESLPVETTAPSDIRSWLGVPLIAHHEMIGVLSVDSDQQNAFYRHHQRFLQSMARQVAIAIQNARLFTESQERASALAEALERLQQLDKMKSQFIQNTSHELRTPVTLIRGHAELLEHGDLGSLKPEQRESVNLIARRSRMLSKMLKDLHVILHTEAQETETTPVELASMLRELSKEFQIRVQATELTLDASIEAETAVVLGNEVHLNRVVDNLVDNAIKFTPAGGHINLRFWKEKSLGILEVSDTGIGIPEHERQRIFERFYQVDGGMTRRYGGTGLGLALVKEIVEAHGGQVTAQSTLGEGSTFRVTLPLVET